MSLLKSALWPAVVVGALCAFYPSLREILKELPSKLKSASTIQVGSFSLAAQEKARSFGGLSLATKIGTLSPNAIAHLLQHSYLSENLLTPFMQFWSVVGKTQSDEFILPSESEVDAYRELETKGLIIAEPVNFREYEALLRHAALTPKWPSFGEVKFKLKPGQKHPVPEQRLRLTKAGRAAVTTIISTVAEELGSYIPPVIERPPEKRK